MPTLVSDKDDPRLIINIARVFLVGFTDFENFERKLLLFLDEDNKSSDFLIYLLYGENNIFNLGIYPSTLK